ncbi:hypothetical protein HHI36_008517 [Cryptolaemus montrouzieri]|uniref:Uncharacterized protein n=1 Tax=Cryptolaemus montrouzieri TaxID=559131 RepID=A0ABD2MT10_9CUCU
MSLEEEQLLLLLSLHYATKKKKRRCWLHEINLKRQESGEYHRLCIELESHKDRFFKYFRMSRECFQELHDFIKWRIGKYTTNWRKPIDTGQRLAICLR